MAQSRDVPELCVRSLLLRYKDLLRYLKSGAGRMQPRGSGWSFPVSLRSGCRPGPHHRAPCLGLEILLPRGPSPAVGTGCRMGLSPGHLRVLERHRDRGRDRETEREEGRGGEGRGRGWGREGEEERDFIGSKGSSNPTPEPSLSIWPETLTCSSYTCPHAPGGRWGSVPTWHSGPPPHVA